MSAITESWSPWTTISRSLPCRWSSSGKRSCRPRKGDDELRGASQNRVCEAPRIPSILQFHKPLERLGHLAAGRVGGVQKNPITQFQMFAFSEADDIGPTPHRREAGL